MSWRRSIVVEAAHFRCRGPVNDPPPKTELAILFTDIVASTPMWLTDEVAMQVDLVKHNDILERCTSEGGGEFVKSTGDGGLAVFPDAAGAVLAACSMRRAFEQETWQGARALMSRMGIHFGAAVRQGADYYGTDLAFAARLHDCAHAGQIVVSEALAERLTNTPNGVSLRALGQHRLRDFPDAVDIFQVDDESHRERFAPLRTIDAQPGNLHHFATPLFGRTRELDELTVLVGQQRLTTITGPGGVGKTRLGMEAGHMLLGEFRDGIWFIDLTTSRLGHELIESVATQLDLPLTHVDPDVGAIVSRLRTWSALLILDNCEQVVDDAARLATSIVQNCPGVRVLATSRQPLDVQGEQVVNLGPLLTSAQERQEMSPACQLFMDRSSRQNHHTELSPSDCAKIDELCLRLDGLPLAIELAAARSRVMSIDEMLDNIGRRLSLLPGKAPVTDGRSRTLRSTLDWSYRLLSTGEQEMLQRLSAFEGQFTLDEVSAVAAGQDPASLDVFDTLGALVDKSMVQASLGQRSRYQLLETVREYASEKLAESGLTEELQELHGNHYLEVARSSRIGLRGVDEAHWVEEIEAAWGDIRAAHRWFLTTDEPDRAAMLAAHVHEFGFWRMKYEYTRWAQAAIGACSSLGQPVTGSAYACTAFGAWSRGDLKRSYSEAETGTLLADEDDPDAYEMVNDALTSHAYFAGHLDVALARVNEQHIEAVEAKDQYRIAYTLWFHALTLAALGRWQEALPLAEGAYDRAKRVDNPSLRGLTSFSLALVILDQEPDEAERLLRESIDFARSVSNRWTEAMANGQLGRLAARSGSLAQALARLVESLRGLQESENATATWLVLTHAVPTLIGLEEYRVAIVVWAAIKASDSAPPRTSAQQRRLRELLPRAEAALTTENWERAVARGASATTSELVDLVEEAAGRLP